MRSIYLNLNYLTKKYAYIFFIIIIKMSDKKFDIISVGVCYSFCFIKCNFRKFQLNISKGLCNGLYYVR
jgi:hypothetical protein